MFNYVEQDLNLRLAGQPWTSAKATADAENLLAVAEGASGAPRIQREAIEFRAINRLKIEDNAINRRKIEASTNSISGTVPGGGSQNIILDNYSFFPNIEADVAVTVVGGASGTVNSPAFRLENSTGDPQAFTVEWRYIVA